MTVTELKGFDRENIILFLYVLAFAIVNFALYYFTLESGFSPGVAEILVLFLYPSGAFLYGYVTCDGIRSFFAGILSYASFILTIMLVTNILNDFKELNYLLLFVGYHLILLLFIGLIGFFASKRQRFSYIISFILGGLWILVVFAGIN